MSKRYNFARKALAVLLSAACFAMLLPAPVAYAATTGGSSIQAKLSEFFHALGNRTTSVTDGDAILVSNNAEEAFSAAEDEPGTGEIDQTTGTDDQQDSAPVIITGTPKFDTGDPSTMAIDLADGDTSLKGSVAASWAAYYEYDTPTHTLTIKQNPPAGYDDYMLWQSGAHIVWGVSIASGVTTDIIANGITVASPTSTCYPLTLAAGAQPTMVLAGSNTFALNDTVGDSVYIPAGAALTFSGSGSVNITASGNSYGINNNGTLTITGGTVTATAAGYYAIYGASGATLNVSGGTLDATGAGSGIHCDVVNISGDAVVNATSGSWGIYSDVVNISGNAVVNATGINSSGIRADTSLTIIGSAHVTAKGSGGYYVINTGMLTIDDGATVYAYSGSAPAIYTTSKAGTGWYVNAFFNPTLDASYKPYTLQVYDDLDNAVTALEGYKAFAFHLPGMTASADYTIFLEHAGLTEEVLRLNDDDPAIYSVNAPTGYSAHTGTNGALPVKLGSGLHTITEKYVDRDGNEIAAQTKTKVAQGGTYSNAMPFITDYAAMGWLWAEDYSLLTPPLAKSDCTDGDPTDLAVTGSRTIYFVYTEMDFIPTGLNLSGGWGMLLLAAMALLMLSASFVWQVQKRRKMN